jgi:C_GCAxxG_C_C family probable redox protein
LTSSADEPVESGNDLAERCRLEAESGYRSGGYNCAEAVLAVVRSHLRPDIPEEIVHLASGFGGGSGSGCICGAVSGATIAFGLVLQNDKRNISRLTRQLHAWFREKYGVTCCKTIRASHPKDVCPRLTGEVAAEAARLLAGA